MSKQIDITTLPGYADLPDGTYDITVKALGDGFAPSPASQSVSYTKGSSSIEPGLYTDNTYTTFATLPEGTDYAGQPATWANIKLAYPDAFSTAGSIVGDIHFGSSYFPNTLAGDLVISSEITSIGEYAFSDCIGLTSIIIPNSVISIGNSAFAFCSSLTSITIPNSVTAIDINILSDCAALTGIVVENGNTKYDSRNNCNAIIETATNKLVVGCKNTSIPNSVTSIGDYAFYWCNSLTSITIPNSVISIGDIAFRHCSNLTSITIPNSVTSIGDSAFAFCTRLTCITISNSVTSIGDSAFYGCYALFEVWNNSNITIIKGDSGNGYVGYYAKVIHTSSSEQSKLQTINDGIYYIDDSTKIFLTPTTCNCTTCTIDSGTTEINRSAFESCSGLTSVIIPDSVTTIGDSAFSGCSSLTSVTIPNSVTSIGNSAFVSCTVLTSITIPDSVIGIGVWAFSDCIKLTTLIVNANYNNTDNSNTLTSGQNYGFSQNPNIVNTSGYYDIIWNKVN